MEVPSAPDQTPVNPTADMSLQPPVFRDRSTGLKIFGVILILLGVLAALMVPLMLLGAIMTRKVMGAAAPPANYVSGCLIYCGLSAVLITLGVGSIRLRRWARALTLIAAWISLSAGILITTLMTAVMPAAFASGFRRAAAANPNAAQLPTGFMAVILTFIIVAMAVFLVILPLAFVIFYSRNDVNETCRYHDPVERWTDRCPLPVLAASLIFACAVPYYLIHGITTPIIPFFGRWLTGIPGTAACVTFAALDTYLAISFFRAQLIGWWIAMVSLSIRAVSATLTFRHGDLLTAYSHLGWKQSQLLAMSTNPLIRSNMMLWWVLAYMLIFIGYMIGIRRYFGSSQNALTPAPSQNTVIPDSPS